MDDVSRHGGVAVIPPEPAAVGSKKPTLKARIVRAGSWTLLAHAASQVLRLGGSLILTRLLVPEMFGVLAIAMVIQTVLSLLSDIGLRQTVIHSARGESRALLDTAWTVQVLRGILIWVVCSLVAAGLVVAGGLGWLPAGSVYAAPELPAMTVGLALAAIVTGFQSTKLMSTNRDLDLRWGVVIDFLSQVIGLVVAVGLAWWTRSIWSFVVSSLVAAIVSTVLSHWWVPGANNRFCWDRASAKELFGYGRWVLLSSLLFVLASNGDRMLLGGWFDAATLGVYGIALNLATVAEVAGSRLFAAVAMPAFSEKVRMDRSGLPSVYFRMRLPFDLMFLLCAGALFSLGPVLVQGLYDSRYAQAGTMLQWLSFTLVFARYGMTGSAYLALGEPRLLTWIHVVKAVSIFVLTPVLYSMFGLTGALIAIAFHAAPTLPVMYWFNRQLGLNDLRFELKVLPAWPLGYALGEMARWLLA